MAKPTGGESGKRKEQEERQILPEQERTQSPLTPAEFHSILQKVKDLGLTWTADMPPRLEAAKPEAEPALLSAEIKEIQQTYPQFPNELGFIVWYVLTGRRPRGMTGSQELLEQKARVIRQADFLSDNYRAAFFFRYATKVPYFSDLDWEVVIKAYERNVQNVPGIPYALVTLHLTNPVGIAGSAQTLTGAVDENLVEKLIRNLMAVKDALRKCKSVASNLREQIKSKESNNASADSPERLG